MGTELKGYWKIEPLILMEKSNPTEKEIEEAIHDKLMDITMNPSDYIGFDEVGQDIEIGMEKNNETKI